MHEQYNARQLLSLGTVIALTPALRLFPARAAQLAGRAGWLAGLTALPLAGGKGFGRPALCVFTLWCLVYAGFVLRSGADRLVGTIYPGASPLLLSQLMGLVTLTAALSTPRSLVRMGRMLLPLLLGVLLILLLSAFLSADAGNLLPVGQPDLWPLIKAAPVPLDIVSGAGTALCMLIGGLKDRSRLFPALGLWSAGLCALLSLVSAAVIGVFGDALTAQLARPFFVLVRTLTFFRTLERVEALVVMLWIFPDFLITALFLWAGQYSLRLLCGYRPDTAQHARLDMGEGRFLIWIGREPAVLERWSAAFIPAGNLCMVFVFLPLLYILGKRQSPDRG